MLDVNADGVLSAEEIENAWLSLILLDVNGDGMVTLEEIQASRPIRVHEAPPLVRF